MLYAIITRMFRAELYRLNFHLICGDLKTFMQEITPVVVNSEFEDGSMLIHHIAKRGETLFMNSMINMVSDIDAKNQDGDTALHIAVRYDNIGCFRILTKNGADCNIQNLDGMTPLNEAVSLSRRFFYIKEMISFGADVNISDNEGWTPLHQAYDKNNSEIIRYLLDNGSDTTLRDEDDNTPDYYHLPLLED